MPSYYVTYGGDRLTFQGVSGPVVWEHDTRPKTDQYVELWRNPGKSMVSSMPLSQPISAFDALAISMMIPSSNTMESTENIYYMPTTGLSGNIYQAFGVPYNRSASSPQRMIRMIKFRGISGTSLSAESGAIVQWNPWSTAINNATQISAISGVKYAK